MKTNATARVQITVEVEAGSWGSDCQISQLYKQAAESGKSTLINALKPGEHGLIKIVGEPKVFGILTEEVK